MYHHGMVPIHDPSTLVNVKDGDVIVVTLDDRRLTPKEVTKLLSTHQSDFVAHALPEKRALRTHALPEVLPFDGHSSYKSEFVKHPDCRRKAMAPSDVEWSNRPFDANTTYKDQFPWHQAQARRRQCNPLGCSLGGASSVPFDGNSSYAADFKALPLSARSSLRPVDAVLTGQPFEGASSYDTAYKQHPLGAAKTCRPPTSRLDPLPFQGCTEYTSEYPGKSVPQPLVHLEPELEGALRCGTASGSPASSWGGRSARWGGA